MRLSHDLRLSGRLLAKHPAFSAVAILVLALGIGVNTAIFSLVNALLFKPLHGVAPGRLVGVYSRDDKTPDSYRAFSYPEYRTLRDDASVFEGLLAQNFAMIGLGEKDATRRVFAGVVSSNFFETLGVPLHRGRVFTPEEETPGSERPVAIVGYGLWKKTGDPDLLGKTLRVNGRAVTVVGIAPEGFSGTMAIASPELWLPLGMYDATLNDFQREGGATTKLADPAHRNLIVNGVLRDGLDLESAAAPLRLASLRLAQVFPADSRDHALSIAPLGRLGVSTRPMTQDAPAAAGGVLSLMASLVLLIACLNLANMMLARGEGRRKEIAVRLALGARRSQVVGQLLVEGLVLAVLGGAVGALLSTAAVRVLIASLEPLAPLAIVFQVAPDGRVICAALVFCVLATVFFGLGPAWKLARADALPELKEHAGEQRPERRRWLAPRNALVVGQVALSLALLTTGGLFVRGALAAAEADPGFRLERGLLLELDPALAGADAARGRVAYRDALERVRGLPGVEAASLASTVPFGPISTSRRVEAPGASTTVPDATEAVSAQYVVVGADYFRALGLPVLRGRDFGGAEEQVASAARTVIVDEPLARRLFGESNPVGQPIRFVAKPGEAAPASEPMEIVGVVPGLRHQLFDASPVPHVYVPFGGTYQSSMSLHVRSASSDPSAQGQLLEGVRRELRAAAPDLPILSATTLQRYRDDSLPLWLVRTGARLFTLFGAVALLLAVVGIYGVKSYFVARRTREIGIRMALGATRGDVLRLVLREGLTLTAAGLAAGLVLALGAGRLVGSLLYQVSPADPLIFGVAPLLLAASALLAAYLPARRATRVAPITALRTE
jgi:predicted permease